MTGGVDGLDGRGGGQPGNDSYPAIAGGLGNAPLSDAMITVISLVMAATGSMVMLMAFQVFGKRRRSDEDGDDEALAASAAAAYPCVPGLRLEPVIAGGSRPAVDVGRGAEIDAHLPRWRRPSLLQARKNDPLRSGFVASTSLTFDGRTAEALDGRERRRIRYRIVSLLNEPDEVCGAQIGSLDEGDEVVLLEKLGTYWRVLCPDGREGWLHKMTLGDVVTESTPTAESVMAGDPGSGVGGFEDILRAYGESHRQFGEA